jgi:hypothetical protein
VSGPQDKKQRKIWWRKNLKSSVYVVLGLYLCAASHITKRVTIKCFVLTLRFETAQVCHCPAGGREDEAGCRSRGPAPAAVYKGPCVPHRGHWAVPFREKLSTEPTAGGRLRYALIQNQAICQDSSGFWLYMFCTRILYKASIDSGSFIWLGCRLTVVGKCLVEGGGPVFHREDGPVEWSHSINSIQMERLLRSFMWDLSVLQIRVFSRAQC